MVPVGDTRTILNRLHITFQMRMAIAGRDPGTDAGCGCQLVGIGMVPRYVMKANGFQGTVRHGVRHGSDIISIMAIISIISIGMK